MNNSQWGFLTSTRFWALVIGAGAIWLNKDGYITEALMSFIAVVAGGFITINTVDKVGKNIGAK